MMTRTQIITVLTSLKSAFFDVFCLAPKSPKAIRITVENKHPSQKLPRR